jgi:hypothetical protein
LNKRVHWAIEQANKKSRRSGEVTTYQYYNRIFADGWRIFLKAEADDLLETFSNNATRAYWKTGVYPLNPNCEAWTDAIESLGAANEISEMVSYEIFPAQEKMPALSAEEKILLRTNLELNDRNDIGDYYVAEIQATMILAKWREHIANGVSEGNDEIQYATTCLPGSMARTDFEKFAMTLVKFEAVDISKVPLPAPKTKEEKAREISETIVDLTPIARPIHISYRPDEPTDNTGPVDSSTAWQKGTAVKGKNSTWDVFLQNGDHFKFNSEQMLSSSNINIETESPIRAVMLSSIFYGCKCRELLFHILVHPHSSIPPSVGYTVSSLPAPSLDPGVSTLVSTGLYVPADPGALSCAAPNHVLTLSTVRPAA